MCRKITRQSRWKLRRASDRAIPNQAPGMVGEGVETGWRASLGDAGTVRLSPKGESDRITQRSVVQIHPPQPLTGSEGLLAQSPIPNSLDRGCFGPQILQGNVLRLILQLPFDRGWQNESRLPGYWLGVCSSQTLNRRCS